MRRPVGGIPAVIQVEGLGRGGCQPLRISAIEKVRADLEPPVGASFVGSALPTARQAMRRLIERLPEGNTPLEPRANVMQPPGAFRIV